MKALLPGAGSRGYSSTFSSYSKLPLIVLVVLSGLILSAEARADCEQPVGRFVDIKGSVETQLVDGEDWLNASLETPLCEGSSIRVGAQSRAAINLVNDAVLRLDENTTMRLVDINEEEEERSLLDIIKGALHSFSRKPKKLSVNSPYLNGSIEGTEFVFRVTDEQSEVTVFEGTVVAANDLGSVSVSGGEAASASQGQAPQSRTVVQPRNAAQWSLYYPTILATGGDQATDVSPELKQAAADLSVGRVDEARTTLDQAIAEGSDAGLAYALRAVINVVLNQLEQALADANQSVALNPDSAATYIALSYAQQASFQINEARDTLLLAVEKQPEDALAWARLAELQLMLGENQLSTEAAQKAVALAPDLGRTQITFGFVALVEFRTADAQAAFEKAIMLDSSDPLPHLGLGLAMISAGDLEQGRSEIEVAVGLGSNDALLRAYLGKAYFEEKRAPLDSEQFAIASQLDPMDPTPWLYEGIALQTQNRPVEAAAALDKSVELNDNRATYRGRLLLDKDRAARGTSLARAYNDLGFEQLGVNEASSSILLDPANSSSHRFLSDSYRNVRRREVSRVSELLQAQMLQDNNINPVQPSVSSTNLNIVTAGGPASAGFSEFTPLFERNKTQFNVSGFGGSDETSGGEMVVSSVFDRYSVSAGAFDYDTDGFRDNNNLHHEIYNLFGQAAISPKLNVQAELGHRKSDSGDLAQNFGEDDFDPSFNRDFDEKSGRLGLRYTANPRSNLLISAIYSDRDQDTKGLETQDTVDFPVITFPPFPAPPIPIITLVPVTIDTSQKTKTDEISRQFEAQHLYQGETLDTIVGVTYAEVDQDYLITNNITFTPAGLFGPPSGVIDNDFKVTPTIRDSRAYAYGNFNMPTQVTWTVGMSYHDYDEDDIDVNRFNPKLGVQWQVTDSLRLRAAWFKVVKPALASNRTLEPTQVAGFNQYFDDTNATRSERIGTGVDWKITPAVFVGAEFSRRELETPEFSFGPSSTTDWDENYLDWDEWTHRAYLYWTPADRWGLSAELVYDKFEGDSATTNNNLPHKVRTYSLPLQLQYFYPNGFFTGFGTTFVEQKVDRSDVATYSEGKSDFSVYDASIGYRFPKRRGIASLTVQNLTDRDFDYQDDSFREFQDDPSTGPYIPDRTVMARFTLSF